MPTPRSISDPRKVNKLVNVEVCPGSGPKKGSTHHGNDVVCIGTRAIVTLFDGLAVVDVSDPANAKTVASMTSLGVGTFVQSRGEQGEVHRMGRLLLTPDGRYALVSGLHGVAVIDLADVDNPVLVKTVVTGEDPNKKTLCLQGQMMLLDGWAYVVNGHRDGFGVSCIDMRNPANPVKVGAHALADGNLIPLGAEHLLVTGHRRTDMTIVQVNVANFG